jgi:FMN phosphatase YigB (HAD superfamily)
MQRGHPRRGGALSAPSVRIHLDALRRLRVHGWRIGIVSNGTADNQLAKIRNTEVGVRKPDPETWSRICG